LRVRDPPRIPGARRIILRRCAQGLPLRLSEQDPVEADGWSAMRNIELMWLTGPVGADFKTIANFRCRDNGDAPGRSAVSLWFWCRQLSWAGNRRDRRQQVCFVNNRDRNHGAQDKRIEQVEASIERYSCRALRPCRIVRPRPASCGRANPREDRGFVRPDAPLRRTWQHKSKQPRSSGILTIPMPGP
jgi:hypothetical protein